MGDFKHLVLVKFKEGVVVDEMLGGMAKLVTELDYVKSFEWGADMVSEETLRQGFTHAFVLTFKSKEDFAAFSSHPKHLEFAPTFASAIENILLFDFNAVLVKPAP
ncbi:Uncharacterized protein QJS10_CPA02g00655 [Acorus calamus]|uniref:Stress-response A/B barrel domain-containing protein n=1 Tax=Acorus calamus TaxID=4465 RepID=A0AAV9FC19_ACOCL|nr:Uncharacterized protein QJS10_CPA02g00645 [Acorus calamus]KAK1324048.1 Uncharacterized protein QJS10_CPA02g00655 [Acorus calamus]